jgi:hypothetical protein
VTARADPAAGTGASPTLAERSYPGREDDRLSERWRIVLTEGHQPLLRSRRPFRHLPSAPRCKVCSNPFAGIGGRALALAGFKTFTQEPNDLQPLLR